MKYFILIFFITLCSISSAQQRNLLSIIDSATLKAIPLATLLINNKVCCLTNEKGEIDLEVSNLKVGDRILISKLGYELSYFDINSVNALPQKIFLKLKIIELAEVKVNSGKAERFKLGDPVSFTINNYLLRPNDQVATYIPSDRFGYIKEIKFNISNNLNGINQPFKMALLKKGEDGKPTSSLLDEDIIVYNAKGKSWIGVDLSAYKIALPKEGMFVVFQILAEEYYDKNQIWYSGSYFYKTPSPALRANKKNEKSYLLIKQPKYSLNWHVAGRDLINLEVLSETE